MKQTIRLTESELRSVIQDSVNEALQDEGFLQNVGRGFKNAFAGDGKRMAKGASNMANNIKRGAQKVGDAIGKRYDAAKVGYTTGRNKDQLKSLYKTIKDLQTKGVLKGPKTDQLTKDYLTQLSQLINSNEGVNTMKYNQMAGENR